MSFDTWHITFTKSHIAIGCEQHSIQEWADFSDKEIKEMDISAFGWWKKWKEIILLIVEKCYKNQEET
jgi:hypothetical protein